MKEGPGPAACAIPLRRGICAARVAGKPLAEMLTLLSSQGIAITGEGLAAADEVREDMGRARKWLVRKSAA